MRSLNSQPLFLCSAVFRHWGRSPGAGESQRSWGHCRLVGTVLPYSLLSGVCPGKRLRGCLSPDGVLLLILQNPACAVIILIYDQVPVGVVARVEVGDHAGGDPQAPHHCRKGGKISYAVDSGMLWSPRPSALNQGNHSSGTCRTREELFEGLQY